MSAKDDAREEQDVEQSGPDAAPAAGAGGDPSAGAEGSDDLAALRRAVADRDEKIDLLQRTAADLDNRRKRTERQMTDAVRYALQDFALDLLPVIDNFERALDHAGESRDVGALHDGLKLVHDQLLGVLQKYRVEKIAALGEAFDPNHHEAVAQVESAEHPDQTVIDVDQQGYRLHDRVIRPSRVIVSREPKRGEEAAAETPRPPADDEPLEPADD